MGGKHSKSMIKKLEERDVAKIKLVFNDLSAPSAGKGIDIETFKQFTQFSDMVSERTFIQFASKKPTLIDLEEFTAGLAMCHRGTEKEKLKVIFRIFAVSFDKVSKDEVSIVLNSAVQASTWNTQTREDLKPPTELVQKLIEMGFPRSQCDKAVEATKATNVDDAVAWILNNKQDPTSDATILLNSMYEGHSDGILNWKKFKKWAMNPKRPKEFAGFMNGFPMLYERAILWTAPASKTLNAGGTVKVDNLIDFTIEDSKPTLAPTPAPVPVKEKRRSHRSLSQLMNRRSVDSMAPVQPQPQPAVTNDSFLDIAFGPTTPTLVPVSINPTHPTSQPTTPSAQTPTNLSAPTTPTLPRQPSNPGSAPATPSSIPPPPSTAAGVTSPPGLGARGRSSTSLSLGAAAKKQSQQDSDDDWSDDDDKPHEIKPVISVVIRDKALEPAPPVDLKKAVSHITLPDLPKSSKPRGHSTVGARARRGSGSRLPLDSAFFDPEKARNSLGDDFDSAPSTPSGSLTPTGAMTPTGSSTPTRSLTPTHRSATPTAAGKEETHTEPESHEASTPAPTPTPAQSTPTATSTATPQTQTATEIPTLPAAKTPSAASEHMRLGMTHLEKGNFADALQEVDKSIHAMLETGDPQSVKGEANFCVAYKVALGLLLEIRNLETKFVSQQTTELASRMGYLSKILSDIPLKTNHRIVCVRMAISKNMLPQAGNYAVAARLVEALLLKGAPDREALQTKLRKCKEEGNDTTLPAYTCPYCSEQCSSASLKCNCGRPVRWCFKTYELITTKNFLQCSFCNALVSTNTTAKSGDKCEFCNHGTYDEK